MDISQNATMVIGSPKFNHMATQLQKDFNFPYQFVFTSNNYKRDTSNLSIITMQGDELIASANRRYGHGGPEIDYGVLFIGRMSNGKDVIWIAGIHEAGASGIAQLFQQNPEKFKTNLVDTGNVGEMWLFRIEYMPAGVNASPKILKTRILEQSAVTASCGTPAKALLCDLGAVLMDFDRARTYRSLGRALKKNYQEIQTIIENSDIRERYENGGIDTDVFKNELLGMLNADYSLISSETLDASWGDIFWENQDMVQALRSIKEQTTCMILLSNTNPLHFERIKGNYPDLISLFDELVLSYKEKLVKPDRRIFEKAIEKVRQHAGRSIENSQILFVDDSSEYIEAAEKLGLRGHTFLSYPHFIFWLRKQGIYVP